MVVALAAGSWPAWLAAGGVVVIILRAVGDGGMAAFGFQRATIKALEEKMDAQEKTYEAKIEVQAKRIDEQDVTIRSLQSVIDNTRDLSPILQALAGHEDRAQDRHDTERKLREKESMAMLAALTMISTTLAAA